MSGQILSQAGSWIQQVALSWLVYNLTGSGTMLGTFSTIRSVTAIGMIPAAGVLTDRVERRKMMMITNAWLFVVTLLFGLLLITGHSKLSYLVIFAFFVSLTYTIDQTLKQIVIFDLVPRAVTPNAIALLLTGSAMMRSFGPAIGGVLIIWFGPGVPPVGRKRLLRRNAVAAPGRLQPDSAPGDGHDRHRRAIDGL